MILLGLLNINKSTLHHYQGYNHMLTYDLFQHNVVVVQQQPQVVQPIRRSGNSDYGTPALVFAIGVTMFIVFFGCWWSLICSIAGIIFAANVSIHVCVYVVCPVLIALPDPIPSSLYIRCDSSGYCLL